VSIRRVLTRGFIDTFHHGIYGLNNLEWHTKLTRFETHALKYRGAGSVEVNPGLAGLRVLEVTRDGV
jgi:hypothetical protein